MKKMLLVAAILIVFLTGCTMNVSNEAYVNEHILLPSYDNNLKLYGYVNENGSWLINPQYPDVGIPPAENLSGVDFDLLPVFDGDKWGYISQLNEWVIKPQYDYAEYFVNGIAKVNQNEYINKMGKYTNEPGEVDNQPPLITPIQRNDKWGYANQTNEIVIAPQYDDCLPFSEGLAAVLYQGLWGFIDEKGNWVITPKFDSISLGRYGNNKDLMIFREGLALARNNDNEPIIGDGGNKIVRVGFINRKGEWAIKPQFGMTSHGFSMGVAYVSDVPSFEKWYTMDGYINKEGKIIAKWISQTDGTQELVMGECLNPYNS